ncbi:MAG: hypothetical protein IKD85_00355 [Firmicutes bacterium]|nr:hypothetical protein [Bacillota bacterium]
MANEMVQGISNIPSPVYRDEFPLDTGGNQEYIVCNFNYFCIEGLRYHDMTAIRSRNYFFSYYYGLFTSFTGYFWRTEKETGHRKAWQI